MNSPSKQETRESAWRKSRSSCSPFRSHPWNNASAPRPNPILQTRSPRYRPQLLEQMSGDAETLKFVGNLRCRQCDGEQVVRQISGANSEGKRWVVVDNKIIYIYAISKSM